MERKSVMEKVKNMNGKMNRHYTLQYKEMEEIYENSKSWVDAIWNSFKYGYMQGQKATKSEMRKLQG